MQIYYKLQQIKSTYNNTIKNQNKNQQAQQATHHNNIQHVQIHKANQ